MRRELIEFLLEQQGIRAQVDELAARQQGLGDLRHFLVQQRLAPRDRDDRGAALVGGLEAVGDR